MDDLLVDARSGVLTSLELHIRSDMPTGWVGWAARCGRPPETSAAAVRCFAPTPTDSGLRYATMQQLAGPATGEAVERYCGNVVPEDLVRGSASALELAGSRVVDPAEFALYSEDQYRLPGFPFVPFTSDLNIRWVLGHTMDEKVPTYVACSPDLSRVLHRRPSRRTTDRVVAVRRNRPRDAHAPRPRCQLCWNFSNAMPQRCGGAGTGHSRRSSFPTGSGCLRTRLLGDLESQTRSVRVLLLPSPFGIPVAAVVDPR